MFGKVIEGLEVVDSVKQGDTIKSVKIEGDADAVLAAKADRVAEWNKILDANARRNVTRVRRPASVALSACRGADVVTGPRPCGRRRANISGSTRVFRPTSLHRSHEVLAMPQLARRIGRAKPSAIMQVAEKAKRLKAEGRDIISFSIGVPNFLPGEHVYAAARDALAQGHRPVRQQPRQRRAARCLPRAHRARSA